MPDIITRTIDIGDGPMEVVSGRTYDVQAVAFADGPISGHTEQRIDIDLTGRLDLTKPGERLFFITEGGFVELPVHIIMELRELR